jgi:hypothetical protein
MNEPLFNLDFSQWRDILLSLLPALINVGIFLYISFLLPRNRTNNSFSVLVLLISIWQTAEGFTRMSSTAGAAFEWSKISEVSLLLIIPFGLLFILHFSEWHKKIPNNVAFPLLFLPAIVLLFFVITRQDKFTIVPSEQWHWVANPEPTLITLTVYCGIAVGALLLLSLIWLFYVKAKNDRLKQKQSLFLALGFTLPVVAGIIVEIIFPFVFGLSDVPVAASYPDHGFFHHGFSGNNKIQVSGLLSPASMGPNYRIIERRNNDREQRGSNYVCQYNVLQINRLWLRGTNRKYNG